MTQSWRQMYFDGAREIDPALEEQVSDGEKCWRKILGGTSQYKKAFCTQCNIELELRELTISRKNEPEISVLFRDPFLLAFVYEEINLLFYCPRCNREYACVGENLHLGSFQLSHFSLDSLKIKTAIKGCEELS